MSDGKVIIQQDSADEKMMIQKGLTDEELKDASIGSNRKWAIRHEGFCLPVRRSLKKQIPKYQNIFLIS